MSSCIESIVQQSSDDLVQASEGYARTGGFTSSAPPLIGRLSG
jgi:hypothetical protein